MGARGKAYRLLDLYEEEEDEEEDVEEVARCMVRGAGDGGSKRTRSWGGKAATMA